MVYKRESAQVRSSKSCLESLGHNNYVSWKYNIMAYYFIVLITKRLCEKHTVGIYTFFIFRVHLIYIYNINIIYFLNTCWDSHPCIFRYKRRSKHVRKSAQNIIPECVRPRVYDKIFHGENTWAIRVGRIAGLWNPTSCTNVISRTRMC